MNLIAFLKKLFKSLPKKFHPQFWVMLSLLTVQSALELLSLGSIIPVVYALTDSEAFFSKGSGKIIADFFPAWSFFELGLCILAGVLLIFLIKNVVSHSIISYQSKFVHSVFEYLSNQLHEYYLNEDLPSILAKPSASIARDIVGVPQRFTTNIVLASLLFLTELFAIIFISAGIFIYEPLAFLCALMVFLPPFVIFYTWIRRKIQHIDTGIDRLETKLSTAVYESVDGYLDILATGSKSFFLSRYQTLVRDFSHLLHQRNLYSTIPPKLAEASIILGVISLFLYAKLSEQPPATITAIFGMYLLGAYRLMPSANRMTLCLLSIKGNTFSMDTVQLISRLKNKNISNQDINFTKSVEFKNVAYAYPSSNERVLKNISFRIRHGECIGIVGLSGAGKSTLLHLLIGALEPSEGEIFIDGLMLKPENLLSWRTCVGYVQQNVFLLSATVEENILFGKTPAPEHSQKLQRAVRMASLTGTISQLHSGLQTHIGDGGQPLSFGQRQRIGIARAIFHGAKIIILDEPTSALDSHTEAEVKESILELKKEAFTVVLVSHKLSTLPVCDRTLTLDKGVILQDEDVRY